MNPIVAIAALCTVSCASAMVYFVYHEKDQMARAGGLIFLIVLVLDLVAFASMVKP